MLTGLWEPLEHGRGQHLTSRPCKSCGVLFKGDYNPSPWLGVGNPRAHSQGLHQTMQSVLLAPVTAALGSAQARILVAKGLGAHTGVPRLCVSIDRLSPGHPPSSGPFWPVLKRKPKQCKEANSILPAAGGNGMIKFSVTLMGYYVPLL